MNYEDFKAQYVLLFNKMMTYSPEMVGAGHYAEKMAALSDEYPEFAERVENEA
jgi:hypothetical protein